MNSEDINILKKVVTYLKITLRRTKKTKEKPGKYLS